MMELRLVQQESHDPSEALSSAWLLTSPDPTEWVREVARWGDVQGAARLHFLRDNLGVLVTMTGEARPPRDARVVPYQKLGLLYFPSDARIAPPVDERDVSDHVQSGIAIWHPACGILRIAEDEAMPVTAFLATPEVAPMRWNLAQPGHAQRPRLISIALASNHEEVSAFIDAGREDIGEKPITEIPSYAGEEKDALPTRAGHAMQEQFYKALEKMTGHGKRNEDLQEDKDDRNRSDGRGGFLNRLGEWAAARLAQIESAQQREMKRLLHMLRTDPDTGLRFAPPLNSRGHRGRDDLSSSSLLERRTDFSLSELGGGHVASPWHIDLEMYDQLRREYREAANRELSLLRFRRAAYIFANLLEDYLAAADALIKGKHFREGALLYRDFANKPLDAADCFWWAGDFESAEKLFVEYGRFEYLGELYARIGRDGASRAAFRKAADHFAQMKDYLEASRVLVDHLGETDRALDVLREGWPFSEQASYCVQEEFALLARWHRHAEARSRLHALVRECPSRRHLGPALIEALGHVAEHYPTVDVRKRAADMVRVETGRRIEGLSANEASRALAVMRALAPNDRLLLRDTQRYLTSRKRHLLPAPPPRPAGAIDLKFFNIISLPNDADWLTIESYPGGYCALGMASEEEVILMRKRWLGRRVNLTWRFPYSSRRFSITPSPGISHNRLAVHIDSSQPLTSQSTAFKSESGLAKLTAGSLQRSADGYLGLTFTPNGDLWELSLEGDAMILKCYGPDSRLLSTAHTASLFGDGAAAQIRRNAVPVPMAAVEGQVFFAFRSYLCRYHQGNFAWLELPDAITEIRCGAADGQPVLAAAMETAGVALVSCGPLWGVWEHHAPDADNCCIRFLHDGLLAVANTKLFELYRINPKISETRRCTRESVKLPNLRAILPGDEPDVVVLMTSLQSHFYRMIEG